MAYRKPNEDVEWRNFLRSHQLLVTEASLPPQVLSSQSRFDDFLMHGYLDHHIDAQGFSLNELNPPARSALKSMVVQYLKAYYDPGMMLFSDEENEKLRTAAGLPMLTGSDS